jgi:hypothetical protein
MTDPATEHRNAAVVFTALATAAAGCAGLVVAGLVLGLDYLVRGDPAEREQRAADREQWRARRYDDAVAWLDADRADRAAYRRAVRDWFESDRATRGDRPSGGETAGRVLARCWNRTLIGASRFRRGWRDGRSQARDRRDAEEPHWWWPPRPQRDDDVPQTPPATGATTAPKSRRRPVGAPAAAAAEPAKSTGRDLVPVGTDEPTGPNPDDDARTQQINDLQAEVTQAAASHTPNPSPPRTALNGKGAPHA